MGHYDDFYDAAEAPRREFITRLEKLREKLIGHALSEFLVEEIPLLYKIFFPKWDSLYIEDMWKLEAIVKRVHKKT